MQYERQALTILVADVAGYTRLMAMDELRVVRELRACQDLIGQAIATFGGFVVDTAGDGILGAFPSSVRAVECALSIQETIAARNESQAPFQKMLFRVGINSGEVIRQDGRIFGDVVNVAARIAAKAEPGSITVSSSTRTLVRGKTACRFDDIGNIPLRNVDVPQQLYIVRRPGPLTSDRRLPAGDMAATLASGKRETNDGAGVAIMAAESRGGLVSLSGRAMVAAGARKLLLIEMFKNLSGNDNLEAFALGLEQDVISELSEDRKNVVRSERNKPRAGGAEDDGATADAQFAARLRLRGSLQQTSDGLRIIATLVDVATGEHLWAEHYVGDGTTDFQVTTSRLIGSAVRLNLMLRMFNLRDRTCADSVAVRPIVNKAIVRFFQQTRESVTEAIALSERALAIDPTSVRAKRTLAASLSASITLGAVLPTPANLERALQLAQEVVLAASQDEIARCELAWALTNLGRHAEACDHLRRAIEINPDSPNARSDLAEQLVILGKPVEALNELETAFALSGDDPLEIWRHSTMAMSHFSLGNYAGAMEVARHMVRSEPAFVRGALFWCASAAALGLEDEVGRAAAHLMKLVPDLRILSLAPAIVPRYINDQHQHRLLEMVRKAGVQD